MIRLVLSIFSFVVAMGLNAQSLRFYVTVSNSITSEYQDFVVIPLKNVKGLTFDVTNARVREIENASGNEREVMFQLDDIDADGHNDELVLMLNVKPGKSQCIEVTLLSDELSPARALTYADMMLEDKKSKYPFITSLEAPGSSDLYNELYHHGAAFENELVAFRVYFDKRQNIDIFGKKLRRLELADTHFYTTPEQMKQDYGNDVLWAGNSIGCGSFKGWDGSEPSNIEPVKIRGQRIVASGPLRTIVEVKDIGWNGLNMHQYYTLYAGQRYCEVRIEFDRPLGNEVFATGVQKVGENPEGFVRKDGVAASWGSDYPEMGKKEQFPPETVGLAVVVPKEYVKDTSVSVLNYLCLLHAPGKTSLKYYVAFCADKELEGYHDAKAWFDAVEKIRNAVIDRPKLKVTIDKK